MVKCSIYQCKKCKTVFKAKWYLWGYDGPFVAERHYDEYEIDKQKCPNCGGADIVYIGKVRITKKEKISLTTNFEKDKKLYYIFPPSPSKNINRN